MALVSHSSRLYEERMAEDYPAIPATAIRLTHLISHQTHVLTIPTRYAIIELTNI